MPTSRSRATATGVTRCRTQGVFVALVLAALVFRLPFAAARARLAPDAIAYSNVARNVASGQGLTSTLKLYYRDRTGVRHGALSDSPPLYPLVSSLIIRCTVAQCAEDANMRSILNLQVGNAVLTSIAAGLVFLIALPLFDRRAAALSGIAAALAPNLFRAGTLALSDPLALVLALSALLMVLRQNTTAWHWFASGLLAGLATLTRFPCLVVCIVLISAAVVSSRSRGNAMGCALGCALATVWMIPLLPSVQALHYAVPSFQQAMWRPDMPIDPWYVIHHPGIVLVKIIRNAGLYGLDLFFGLRGLFLLSLGLPLWFLRPKSAGLTKDGKLALWIAAASFAVYALTWSIPPVRGSRFLLLTYCLLLPFCVDGMLCTWDRWGARGRSILALCCAATIFIYTWGCVTAANSTDGQFQPLPASTRERILQSLRPGSAIASNNPWIVSYSTNAPTALLPHNLTGKDLDHFVTGYRIGEIVLLGGKVPAICNLKSTISNPKCQGQNAYDGTWQAIPQIVQKLPSTHSPSITPRKNGSARL